MNEIGLQQRATLVVNTPSCSIPTGVKVTGLDIHGEELQLCPKLKKDHDCVTKTLHEELFAGGAKVDVTFYCKGSNSGGCKTKKPARVCLSITLIYEEGIFKFSSSPFTVKGNRRQKIKRLCNSTRRENLSVTTVIESPSFTEVPLIKLPTPLQPSPPPATSLNHSPNLADIVKMEQPKIKLEKNCNPAIVHHIKQEPASTTSDPFIQMSEKYKHFSPQNRGLQISFNTPKTEDFRPIRQSLPTYYYDSGGPLDNSHAPYFPNHNSTANSFHFYQKGHYSPEDYSIPPDEEGDHDYYSEQEEFHLPFVKVESYPFNVPVIDKPYSGESYVNSMDYYQPMEPRDEVRYGYRFVKRRCLGKGMY